LHEPQWHAPTSHLTRLAQVNNVPPTGPGMLQLTALSKRYGKAVWAVRDLDLTAQGGVLGLLGPNGAGKTTLMQMIATVTRPTAGEIRFRGEDVLRRPEALRARLGYLPQDFGTYDSLSAEEHLTYFAGLKGVRSRARVREMLERVNLHATGRRAVGGFSGGMKQRLGIAQALISDPDLLIVDEPTAGLDPEERVRFRNLLADLGGGKLVILSTHIVSDVESVASRIAVMRAGRLLAIDAPEGLLAAARGRVWEGTASSADYEGLRQGLTISKAVRVTDGVRFRAVAEEQPTAGLEAAEPTLEDAYLWCMRRPADEEAGAAPA
jgi:ABC-2 type transport system ATP-binding protein